MGLLMTQDQTNEIPAVSRGKAAFFAWFKELISITSVYNGSDKWGDLDSAHLLFISCGLTGATVP